MFTAEVYKRANRCPHCGHPNRIYQTLKAETWEKLREAVGDELDGDGLGWMNIAKDGVTLDIKPGFRLQDYPMEEP
jgi:hypothetical protein